jgi:hypothetical protein
VRTKKPLEHVQRLVMLFIRKWINIRIVKAEACYAGNEHPYATIHYSTAATNAKIISLAVRLCTMPKFFE